MKNCLTEENLIELFYGEESQEILKKYNEHLYNCPVCKQKFENLKLFLDGLNLENSIEGGELGVINAISNIKISSENKKNRGKNRGDILTIDEVADYLKVNSENVRNMLHLIPHFVFDGNIRIRKEKLLKFIEELEKDGSDRYNFPNPFLKREIV